MYTDYFILTIALAHFGLILFFTIGLLRKSVPGTGLKSKVSVVIAARNEEANISDSLNAVFSQDYPSDLFEVILVNDRSEDATREIAGGFTHRHPNLRILDVDSVPDGVAPKKNALTLGVATSTGEIIIETDADTIPHPSWISSIVERFSDDTGLVIGAAHVNEAGAGLSAKFEAADFLMLVASAQGAAGNGVPLGATGQNLAYRKSVFSEVGGLTTDTNRYVSNDTLFLHKVRKTPWKIVGATAARASVITKPVDNWRELISQRARWASNAYWMGLSPLLLIFLITNFIINISLIAIPLIYWLAPDYIHYFLLLLAYKFTAEGVYLSFSAVKFNRKSLLPWFPLWFLVTPFYVIIMSALGAFGRTTWKDHQIGRTTFDA